MELFMKENICIVKFVNKSYWNKRIAVLIYHRNYQRCRIMCRYEIMKFPLIVSQANRMSTKLKFSLHIFIILKTD